MKPTANTTNHGNPIEALRTRRPAPAQPGEAAYTSAIDGIKLSRPDEDIMNEAKRTLVGNSPQEAIAFERGWKGLAAFNNQRLLCAEETFRTISERLDHVQTHDQLRSQLREAISAFWNRAPKHDHINKAVFASSVPSAKELLELYWENGGHLVGISAVREVCMRAKGDIELEYRIHPDDLKTAEAPAAQEKCPTCGSADKAIRESVSKPNCGPPLFPCQDEWHTPQPPQEKWEPKLTGKEEWFVASQEGETIWIRQWGDLKTDWWWPMCFCELDTGLIKIDVCGKQQNMHLDDCAEIRIGTGKIIKNEDFYEQPAPAPSTDKWTPKFKVGQRVKHLFSGALGEVYEYDSATRELYVRLDNGSDVRGPNESFAWSLPTPPAGQQWHRTDGWKAEWLPEGWRPLLLGEARELGDQHPLQDDKWLTVERYPAHENKASRTWTHCRTRRPLPPAQPATAKTAGEADEAYDKWVASNVGATWPVMEWARQAWQAAIAFASSSSETSAKVIESLQQSIKTLTKNRDEWRDAHKAAEAGREAAWANRDRFCQHINIIGHEVLGFHPQSNCSPEAVSREVKKLVAHLRDPGWVKCSDRIPTVEDSDRIGNVLWRVGGLGGHSFTSHWRDHNLSEKPVAWMRIPAYVS